MLLVNYYGGYGGYGGGFSEFGYPFIGGFLGGLLGNVIVPDNRGYGYGRPYQYQPYPYYGYPRYPHRRGPYRRYY